MQREYQTFYQEVNSKANGKKLNQIIEETKLDTPWIQDFLKAEGKGTTYQSYIADIKAVIKAMREI